jgi:hypothetical protein
MAKLTSPSLRRQGASTFTPATKPPAPPSPLLTTPTPSPLYSPPQAKEALTHPYFDDLDRAAVDALENPDLEDAGEPDF